MKITSLSQPCGDFEQGHLAVAQVDMRDVHGYAQEMAMTPLIKAPKEHHTGTLFCMRFLEDTLMPTGPMLYCICGAARSKSPNYGQFGRLGDAARIKVIVEPSPMPKLTCPY